MDSGENKRALWVGLFISIGLVILIIGIFTLGNQQKSFVKGLHLKARFTNVSGLIKGNNVWFSGVKVGTIKNITFTGINQVDVEFNIDQSIQQYVHRNALATIGSEGFIGNKTINIEGGTPDAPVVQNGDSLSTRGILSTDDIMKTLQKNNENLLSITSDFKVLSKNMVEGKGLAGALLADSSLAMRFRAVVANLQTTTASTNQMAIELNRFGRKMNTKGGLADKMLTDTAVFAKLQQSANQLQEATAKAGVLTDNLNRASGKLNTTDNAIGVLLNDQPTANQLKSTLDYLNQSSIKLNDDLEAAQHNFLLRGFFKKRKKEQKKAQEATNKN
ncbi:MCE family protein [Mucilaginibacter sp. Bleaf8]|uniref:MlaD family protein n=1 Tax=Mucilaginibacter sp. Bleaf8 TaxID=2834430 RepID=UPI001BCBD50F|nr:MlaD family protein [Mucilaginibacter sp. Bleaf8]MBS7563186.1 MCE family protein [Mucilaginibacter sp. Bleaf8]